MDAWLQFIPFAVTDYLISGILLVLAIISWYYHISLFGKIRENKPYAPFREPVSLVIAARNEISNLQQNLPHWLNQQYFDYEVIIADDGSTDGSSEWIIEQMAIHPKLKLVMLDAEYVKMHGKKIALTLAFKKAVNRYFILTDADCTPASDQWLSAMASGFSDGKDIVIGYSPYMKKPGFLNAVIRYETFLSALNCFGYAQKGKPYMGVGRNMGYSRKVYEHVQGFSTHSHIPAGDDDLFVQSAANAHNVNIVLQQNAFTESIPKTTLRAWWKQKLRHLWVGKFYNPEVRRRLSVLPLVQFLFAVISIVWFFLATQFWYPFVIITLKWLPEWWVKGRKAKLFMCRDLVILFPLLSLANQIFYMISGTGAFFAKRPKW